MSSLHRFIHYQHVFLGCVCSVVSDSLRPHGLQPVRLLCPWDSPGKNTGVGCHVLLQGIFPPKDQTRISFVSCIGKQVLHWATCFPISTDLNIWVISTDSFHWSFFFLLSVDQVFLFLPTSNNLALYPRYCKWHVLETLDSVLLFQRKILFVFCRQLTWLSSNSKLSPSWWAAAKIKVQCFFFFFFFNLTWVSWSLHCICVQRFRQHFNTELKLLPFCPSPFTDSSPQPISKFCPLIL